MARTEFGTTWWGRAWIQALERSEVTDGGRLGRGRTSARRGAVYEIELLPGHIAARVVGTNGELYDVTIGVKQLASAEWEQVAEAIGARAAHLAALLDGELHPGVVDDAAAVDVTLLPRASDLRPDCSCPDWGEPCTHAAAVCYVAAAELDRNPFSLFLLRGITSDGLIELVRARRNDGPTRGADPPPAVERAGTDAAVAWAGAHLTDELTTPPDLPIARRGPSGHSQPGRHAPWVAELPDRHGIDPRRVDDLAVDAVGRAWAMLVDDRPSGVLDSPRADLARRASAEPDRVRELADLAGVTPARLRAWSAAWRAAGELGVTVLADTTTWSTDQVSLSRGRDLLVELGVPRRSIALNYDSLGMAPATWLVFGPDQRWYRLSGPNKHQDLQLTAAPAADIRDLVEVSPR